MNTILLLLKRGSFWSCLLVLALFVFGCQPDTENIIDQNVPRPSATDASVALAYHELFLDLERFTPGYRPPVSARASAYISWIGYETIVPISSGRSSLAPYFNVSGLPEPDLGKPYHWSVALVEAYTQSMVYFFPNAPAERLFALYQLRNDFYEDFKQEVSHETFSRSAAYGREMAAVICDWSATDTAGHEAFLRNNDPSYVPPGGEGRWQPTFPDFSPALLPRWGSVRTFAADETDIIPEPLAYSTDPSSEIYQQALTIYNIVNEIKAGGRDEDRWIGEFWSDDCPILTFTPAGRWYAVANQLVSNENLRLDEAVTLYAHLGMALNDAGVRAWAEKYRHNYERPIDYIRRVMPGNDDWNTIMCPDGSGNYFTPNFPAYPSGHATFGAVASVVFEKFFGPNVGMTDRCHEGRTEFRGAPRSFASFREMAEENAYSRIPLGVHFQMDSDTGLDLGYQIGAKINDLPWGR